MHNANFNCRDVCNGMEYLSSRGFVHRDVAARNVLLNGNGQAKVATQLMLSSEHRFFPLIRYLILALLVRQKFMCLMKEENFQLNGQLLKR